MYQPSHFAVTDPAARSALALEVIAAHPFASLVSQVEGLPFATHCPMTAHPPSPPTDGQAPATAQAAAPGFVLEGHLAGGNPHWRAWRSESDRVLVMFHGPHAYVSPTLYARPENVPTWNYVAVHIYGRIVPVEDREDKHGLLKRLIRRMEPAYEAQWNALDEGYQYRMLDAIVGFRVLPESVEAKFKVSQNRLPVDRDGVRKAFSQGDPQQQALADWMARLGA